MKSFVIQDVNFKGAMRTAYIDREAPDAEPLLLWTRQMCKAMFDEKLKKNPDQTKLWIEISDWMHQQSIKSERHKEWAYHCFQIAMQVWDDGYKAPAREIPNLLGI